MKKYKIELSESQMRLVANCLEDISRFASGQCELSNTIEEMVRHDNIPFDEQIRRRNTAEILLGEVKRTLLPKLLVNESKGYNGTEFIGNTYQIYRTILYQLAKDNNWSGVYSSPALSSGNMGSVLIKKVN